MPELPPIPTPEIVLLENVSATAGGRRLFSNVSLTLSRERVALTGPNGSGKTTLLEILLAKRLPDTGRAVTRHEHLGVIEQGAANWMQDNSLYERLAIDTFNRTDQIAETLVASKFPLALARRPMKTLSPGERVRAALICILQQRPAIELLVLDEPTNSLDSVGLRALEEMLCAWKGGLIIASHDRSFLSRVGIEQWLAI